MVNKITRVWVRVYEYGYRKYECTSAGMRVRVEEIAGKNLYPYPRYTRIYRTRTHPRKFPTRTRILVGRHSRSGL